jgi:RHS repeat-associated protein
MPPADELPPGAGLALLLLYGSAAVLLWQLALRLGPERRLGTLVALGTGSAFLVVFLVPPGLRPARAQATPGITYYHQDHLGSTVIVTGGPAATRVVYAPFGKVVAETAGGSTAAPDVGFTGQRFEAAVGLYDYGARWYHPDLGHFLTPDGLVPDAYDSQSLNRYAYVRNNPINKIDPTGNTPIGFDAISFDLFGPNPLLAIAGGMDPATAWNMVQPPPGSPPPAQEPRSELEMLLDPFGEGLEAARAGTASNSNPTYTLRGEEWVARVGGAVAAAIATGGASLSVALRGGAEEMLPVPLPSKGLIRVPDFRDTRSAFMHYAKHVRGLELGRNGNVTLRLDGADMPEFPSFADYRSAARSFFSGDPSKGVHQFVRSNGDLMRLDTATGHFGVMQPSGVIRTFFRPDDPTSYFMDQLR